jgi:hypothetical protein
MKVDVMARMIRRKLVLDVTPKERVVKLNRL